MAEQLVHAIAEYLAAAGIGLTEGTNLTSSLMPDTSDDSALMVTVYEDGGAGPEMTFGANTVARYGRVRIVVRHKTHDTARNMLTEVFNKLNGARGTSLGGMDLLWCIADGEAKTRPRDGRARYLVEQSYNVTFRKAA